MKLFRKTLPFPIFEYNLNEDYFIDITISRYFQKLTTEGLDMSIVSILFWFNPLMHFVPKWSDTL